MRNIYLDIDGVLNRTASPQADIVAFLTYLLDHYPNNLYWLTTFCYRGENNTLWVIQRLFEPDFARRIFDTVQPTNWSRSKTEGIDFTQPFIWFDDHLLASDRKILTDHGALTNFFLMNPRNPNVARKALDFLKSLDNPPTSSQNPQSPEL